ncbi:M28 family peptidase [Pontibacter sp. BT310]|uniref:M28 family peptidase n=1 Tax=Pontibacter populi TaxID=890055 RepID=A0ABS6XC32_9BACT|nr:MULTISPECIES: M28 family peptidase [Pontibacter]MBJ6117804.1 M28 family peptidase [Pontibacter sp. BT310]MBR0570230.1 M28 family peptidase [Microvirga sp. STS03]MBW3364656.1 M28 family peptidase [Pontibacter populi]
MKHLHTYGFVLAALLASGCASTNNSAKSPETNAEKLRAAATTYGQTITAADLSKHLNIIASDEYEGRNTGEKGQKMAAAYIAKEFKEDGLTGPVTAGSNPYYQTFDLEKSQWGEGHILIGDKKFLMMQDFFVLGSSPYQTEQTTDVVFAGYGIDDEKYSDYANVDVTGKMVVVLAGEPKGSNGNYLISGTTKASDWGNDYRSKRNAATKRGAKSVLIVTGTSADEFNSLTQRYKSYASRPSLGLKSEGKQENAAVMFVSPVAGAALLNTTPEKLLAYSSNVAKAGKPVASAFTAPKNVKVVTSRITTPVPTENVLGFIEGSDKKDEVVVVTAHYDHVGIEQDAPGDDKIFNGANDDGSGTVAVIELAEAFAQAKKEGKGPRRSILFMTVTAEEKGLLGSEYYSENPIFPLANTVANVNIDMIGRMDFDHEKQNDSNYIYVIGSDKLSSELHSINEEANQKYVNLKLDYKFNDENDPNRFYYRSDHYNFAKNGIPIIFYFNGVHADYHKASDSVDKILFDSAEKVARLAFYTTWELANRDNRIVVDSNKK